MYGLPFAVFYIVNNILLRPATISFITFLTTGLTGMCSELINTPIQSPDRRKVGYWFVGALTSFITL